MTPRKVVVLGGGVGAMTAAFALTARPEARSLYDVTVYQLGWRLGGKGASGRRASEGQRIEEHGLHVWSGFYDNAIRLMKDCFAELERNREEGVHRSFDQAFTAHNNIVLGDRRGGGDEGVWTRWAIEPKPSDAEPGEGGVLLSPMEYLRLLVAYVRDLAAEAADDLRDVAPHPRAALRPDHAAHAERRIREAHGRGPDGSAPGEGRPQALRWLHDLATALPEDAHVHDRNDRAALEALARQARDDVAEHQAAQDAARKALSDEARRTRIMLDLGAAAIRGMVLDDALRRGFDWLDGEEATAWLLRHGAREESVDSALVRAVYDYAFGYRNGVTTRGGRAIAAGTFLRGVMRLCLTYKGSIFYKMNAGMGDTIFTPFYKALKSRGVKFKFFHKITALRLDPTGRRIERIEIDRQATPLGGTYDPFPSKRVKGLDCWPCEPLYDRLAEGAELRERRVILESSWTDWAPVEKLTLRRGEHFDDVILGISLGALFDVAQDLIEANPSWRIMVEKVETVATQAMQLWLRPKTADLGWPGGSSILTAYEDDLNTWADLTHLDATEDWPEHARPGSIAYFCGPMRDPKATPPYVDHDYPTRAEAEVRSAAAAWMERHGAYIFPDAFDGDGRFDETKLISLAPPGDGPRWDAQFFRANIEPTERYVLSVPGSTDKRLRADRSGFDNLWLAGDWTYTGINAGCVEAAAMSGLRAAAGLAGVLPEIVGEEADPVPGRPAVAPQPPVLASIRPQNSSWPWSGLYGMAETVGATVILPIPRGGAQAMLPKGLELAPQTLTPPDMHPVILLFGQQRDVRPNALPFGMSYLEFICAVPWVRHAGGANGLPPLICPTRLYLDSTPPILLGVLGYGFPKQRAAMAAGEDYYVVRDARTDEDIVSCWFRPDGPQRRAFDLPAFSVTRAAYEMAMVTKNRLGQWQYSVYDFSLGQALLQPIRMEIRIGSDRFGLPNTSYTTPSLAESPLGAFFLTSDATINNPLQSFDLLRTLRGLATAAARPRDRTG